MKPETAQQLTEMMSRVVEEGTGTAGALAGITVAGKTGTAEVGANREFNQPWFIAFAPVEDPQDGDRRDGRADAPARAGRWPRRSPSRCSRPCWGTGCDGGPRMTEVADRHARRRPLPHRAPPRLRRAWPTSTRPRTRIWARGRAQGAAPALRAGPGVRGALPARGQGRGGPLSTRTWSACSTAASTRAPTTSRWSYSPGRRSRSIVADEAPLAQRAA